MKQKIKILLLSFGILFLTNCSEEEVVVNDIEFLQPKPTAKFTFTQVDENDPFTYSFKNESINFNRVLWAFADDSTSSVESPVHTFKKTGTYDVKLIAFNGEDFWAQREEKLTISADELLEVVAIRQNDGSITLSFETAINIEKVEWIKGILVSSPIVSRERNYNLRVNNGVFDSFKLRAYTVKGSMIETIFMLSEFGVVEDFTFFDNNFTVSKENDGGPTHAEGSIHLIDNLSSTKFYTGNIPSTGLYWQFEYFQPIDINAYAMTSANNLPARDPYNWQMLGSQDGMNWTILDSRTSQLFATRFLTRIYTFNNTTKYKFYRFLILKQNGDSGMQHAEFKMLRLPM